MVWASRLSGLSGLGFRFQGSEGQVLGWGHENIERHLRP